MLATLGVLVQSFYHLPDPVFANGARPQTAAYELVTSRPEALAQIFLAVGAIELLVLKQDADKAPGDLGFGAYPDTEEELETLQLKELKNGRLAMISSKRTRLRCDFLDVLDLIRHSVIGFSGNPPPHRL